MKRARAIARLFAAGWLLGLFLGCTDSVDDDPWVSDAGFTAHDFGPPPWGDGAGGADQTGPGIFECDESPGPAALLDANDEAAPFYADYPSPPVFRLSMLREHWQELYECWRNPPPAVRDGTGTCYTYCAFSWTPPGGAEERFSAWAACKPKGNVKKWSLQNKPQLVVRFNKWTKDPDGGDIPKFWDAQAEAAGRSNRKMHDMKRLNLEYNEDYLAPIRDRLGMWLMRRGGVHASRVNHVRLEVAIACEVTVHGKTFTDGACDPATNPGVRDFGIYQNIEPVDTEHLERRFENPNGNLYDEADVLDTNLDVADKSRLEMLDALFDSEAVGADHTVFAKKLQAVADVDQLLGNLAVEAVLPTGDNFSDGGGNFYWYDEHPGPGFAVIPWDLDDLFSKYAPENEPLFSCQGTESVTEKPYEPCLLLLDHEPWASCFRAKAKHVLQSYGELAALAASYCEQIRPHMTFPAFDAEGEPSPKQFDAAGFDADCKSIQDRIAARKSFLSSQL